jgi:hypothetical protein
LAEQDNIFLAQQHLTAELGMPPVPAGEEWKRQLAATINQLIQTDFARLINILYRLDVSESRLKQLLQQEPDANAGELIANLMIERQLEKIASRKRFSASNNIPDDEKW